MKDVIEFMRGKKTYLVAFVAAVVAGLQAYGVEIPEYVLTFLGAIGLYTLRAGVAKM